MHITPWPFYGQYPLNKRLDGPQGRSGRFGENCLFITEIQTPDRRVCSVVTTPTELPRLNIKEFLKVKTFSHFWFIYRHCQQLILTSVTASNSRMAYELEGVWNGAVEA